MYFERFQILNAFFCLVFLKAFLSFLSESCSFPTKSIDFTLTLSPLSTLTSILTSVPVESGIELIKTLVL